MTEPRVLGAADAGLLLRVVKDCQKMKVQGAQGSWKDYLKAQTPSLSKTDPAAHTWQVHTYAYV